MSRFQFVIPLFTVYFHPGGSDFTFEDKNEEGKYRQIAISPDIVENSSYKGYYFKSSVQEVVKNSL